MLLRAALVTPVATPPAPEMIGYSCLVRASGQKGTTASLFIKRIAKAKFHYAS